MYLGSEKQDDSCFKYKYLKLLFTIMRTDLVEIIKYYGKN
jgi:hypothetical protein